MRVGPTDPRTAEAQRWEQLERLFEAALEMPATERSPFLADQCGCDLELRAEIEEMIAVHEDDRSLAIEARLLETSPEGLRAGPYRLLEPIGRGGMGEVYLAERADAHYQQQVAIKLLRPGFYGAEMISRFERERQILARLEHPNIATLLDGGVAEDGRPYLVMQYVEGVPITKYCDRLRLPLAERLQLFVKVCQAVQFSHSNLVVHRDLKPSNILVTESGEIKLLDFGIAKLLDPEAAVDVTRAEVRVMTPERAAPEQLLGEPVTAAVDVYGLGILLCELLCGRVPYRPSSRDAQAIARDLSSRAPSSPSVLLRPGSEAERSTDEPTTEVLAEQRRCRPEVLRRQLAGDLDRIVLMALRHEPERRYVSAVQLGEDVERYLAGEPVLAHRDSPTYRARKFLERHKLGVSIAALFTVLVLVFGVVTAFQSRSVALERDRANAERDRAEAVVQILTGLIETADPVKDPGRDQISVTELLERGEQRLEDLKEQPETQARLLLVLGRIHAERDRYAKARELLERARDIYGQQLVTIDATSLDVSHQLGRVIRRQGHLEQARHALAAALAEHRQHYGSKHVKTAGVMIDLAAILPLPDRRALLEEALAVRRDLLDPQEPAIASALDALASYHHRMGEYETARQLYQEALDIMLVVAGEKHPHTLTVLSNLAGALDDPDESIRIMRRVLELRQEILPDSVETALAWNNLGVATLKSGRFAEAREALEAARKLFVLRLGADHWQVGNTTNNLSRFHELQGDYESALANIDRALELLVVARGPEHIESGLVTVRRALILAKLGHVDQALAEAQRGVETVRQATSEPTALLAQAVTRQGWVLLAAGTITDAEAVFREALAIQSEIADPDVLRSIEAEAGLGLAMLARGQRHEARERIRDALARLEGQVLADPYIVQQLRTALAAST